MTIRDVDMDKLKGILVDLACLVDPYILNREAEMLQWKLLFVEWDEEAPKT